jgi:hypothetical protein
MICRTDLGHFQFYKIILFANRGYAYHNNLFILILCSKWYFQFLQRSRYKWRSQCVIDDIGTNSMNICPCSFVYITLFTKIILDKFVLSSFTPILCIVQVFLSKCIYVRLRSRIQRVVLGIGLPSFFSLFHFQTINPMVFTEFSPWFHDESWSLLGILKAESNFWIFWFYLLFGYLYLFK